MRRAGTLLLVATVLWGTACSGDGYRPDPVPPDPDINYRRDGGVTTSEGGTGPSCNPVTVSFAGTVVTVANSPLGLDGSIRTDPVGGAFTYLPCLPDEWPTDKEVGKYEHIKGAAFSLSVAGMTINGSGRAQVRIENLSSDTFRWLDGDQPVDPKVRVMTLDGQAKEDLAVSIAIVDESAKAFSDDSLPTSFPMLAVASYPHTFAVKDSGGTMLLQLSSLKQQ